MTLFKLIDSIAQPCKAVNEDLFDYNEQAAWILDGASSIGPKMIADAPTDPYWLVQTFNKELKKIWNDKKTTCDLFKDAAEATIQQFGIQAPSPAPAMIDRPTACLLMARIWQDKLELSTVGDCWLLHQRGTTVTEFGHKIGDIAAPIHRERARLKATGVSGKDLEKSLLPLEREFRAKANIDGGYAIIDLTTRWINRMAHKNYNLMAGDKFLLMTDGFYRLIDTFNLYTPVSLMETACAKGLTPLLTKLRDIEKSDEECISFPRIKIRDDVAAALLAME